MAILVVGGSGKDVGKTALVCGIISALREFAWTAVKITGHDYAAATANGSRSSSTTIWEETSAGVETDTARYLAAGARRALLVTRYGTELPIDEIRRALGSDRNIIFESNRIVDVLRPDVCIALMSGTAEEKDSFKKVLSLADAVVSVGSVEVAGAAAGNPRFCLQSGDRVSPEMVKWLRARLETSAL